MKKHQDRVQDAKRQEIAKKVKKLAFHRSTMAPIVPRWELLACQEIRRNKSEENLSIAARYSKSLHDGVTWRPS
jgi:hypothetical protein